MYEIIYLPVAKEDIEQIVTYIAATLQAPKAAIQLLDKLERGMSQLTDFPYSFKVYYPVKPLKDEYRVLTIENYLIFYVVDEQKQTVEIRRVIYAKRDLEKLFH